MTESEIPVRITYKEVGPPQDLENLVLSFWEMEVVSLPESPFQHRIVPDASTSVVLARHAEGSDWKVHAVGPRTEAVIIPVHAGEWFSGVRFLPGIASQVFGLDASKQVGALGPAMHLVPEFATALQRCLSPETDNRQAVGVVANTLREFADPGPKVDMRVVDAFRHIRAKKGDLTVADLASAVHIGERQVRRLFRQHVGLSPKQVIRLVRLRATAEDALDQKPGSWSRIAIDRGFSDQAHLTRDVRELTGLTPAGLDKSVRHIDHIELNG